MWRRAGTLSTAVYLHTHFYTTAVYLHTHFYTCWIDRFPWDKLKPCIMMIGFFKCRKRHLFHVNVLIFIKILKCFFPEFILKSYKQQVNIVPEILILINIITFWMKVWFLLTFVRYGGILKDNDTNGLKTANRYGNRCFGDILF